MNAFQPEVSVIMPCHNHGRFVSDSIQSILAQTCPDFELIVVDDASKDNSRAVIQELVDRDKRIRLISHERNLGASRSRNDGLRNARGKFVAFCDADDLWKPDKLKSQLDCLMGNPVYGAAYCDADVIDETGRLTGALFSDQFPVPTPASGDLFPDLCLRNFINMQTVVLRRDAVGGDLFFDENIKWVEDWWQWVRLSKACKFFYDKRPLAQYRVHTQSTGLTQRPGIRVNRWKVCRRNLALHPDLSISLRAHLWYMMGLELSAMGRRRWARNFLCHAVHLRLNGNSSPKLTLKMMVRCGLAVLAAPWSRA